MSLAKRLADQVSVPTQQFESNELTEDVPVAQLSIGSLANVDERIDVNLWNLLLDLFSENLNEVQTEDPEELKEQVNQEAMLQFLRELDYKLQVELIWESYKVSMGTETTREQADYIYSYGLTDNQQMEALMFTLQGVQEDEIEQQASGDSGNQTSSTSETEE